MNSSIHVLLFYLTKVFLCVASYLTIRVRLSDAEGLYGMVAFCFREGKASHEIPKENRPRVTAETNIIIKTGMSKKKNKTDWI